MKGLAALALGTALAVPASPAGAQPTSSDAAASATSPSLAGKWTLNKELSEDARAKMGAANAGHEGGSGSGGSGGGGGYGGRGGGFGGHGGYGGHGGGGGYGGRGGYGGSGGGGGDPSRHGGSGMRAFFDPPENLTISQTADDIALDDGQRVVHLHPDGKKVKSENGGPETTTKWRENELVVESKSDRGAKMTTAYMLVPEKHQLHITSTVEGRGEPVTVRRVYDAAPAEGGGPQ